MISCNYQLTTKIIPRKGRKITYNILYPKIHQHSTQTHTHTQTSLQQQHTSSELSSSASITGGGANERQISISTVLRGQKESLPHHLHSTPRKLDVPTMLITTIKRRTDCKASNGVPCPSRPEHTRLNSLTRQHLHNRILASFLQVAKTQGKRKIEDLK